MQPSPSFKRDAAKARRPSTQLMHTFAKFLFFLASAVTALMIGAFFFVGFVGDSEDATFALGWLSITAIAVWISVAGVLILLMAATAKAGQARLIGTRSVYEWVILALLLLLAAHLINSSYLSVWSGVTDRWYHSPVWPMLTLLAGLTALVSGVALLLRHRWSLQLLLVAVLALFVRSSYETVPMFHTMPFTAFLVGAGIKNFTVMIVLASYVYQEKSVKCLTLHSSRTDSSHGLADALSQPSRQLMRLTGWRLTADPSADPNAEAARYRLGGRPLMAEFVLEEAIKREPGRLDLRNHLARLRATRTTQPAPERAGTVSWAFVAFHVMVAWALFIVLLIATLVLPLDLVEVFAPAPFQEFPSSLSEIGTGIALMVIWVVGALVLVVRLFSLLWFRYLGLLPEAHALAADAALPPAMRTSQFGASYIVARKVFFAERYGGSRSGYA